MLDLLLSTSLMTTGQQLLSDIRRVGAGIDPAKVSNTKWLPIEAVVAEAMQRPDSDFYMCTVSKSGNVPVRFQQSDRAVAAKVVLVAYNGPPSQLDGSIEAAINRHSRQSRDLVLFFLWPSWRLAAAIKTRGSQLPPVIASAGPSAVIDV
jgi:hypothetical protein